MRSIDKYAWIVTKEGTVCGKYTSRSQAEAGVQQLAKLYPPETKLTVQYVGRNIPHCTTGGKPL